MPLTLGDLRAETLGWLDETAASTSDQSYLNVTAALKQAHIERLTADDWKFMLWPSTATLSTVASQTTYSLHQLFLKPFWVRNLTRSAWLMETPSRNIELDGITPETDQDTNRFMLAGMTQVASQPSSASVVTIVSTSASDNTAAKAITIWGDTVDGVTSETLTPSGTTPVAGTVSFTHILSITKAAAWVGTLTVSSNSAAVTNLKLFASEFGRQYPQLQLLYLPTAGETISYRFYRRPRDLSAANDLTDIPAPFERILIYDALCLLGAYDNRLDGGRMQLWTGMREKLDFQMRQVFMEGQAIGAEGRFIRARPDDGVTMRMPD